MNPLTQVKNTQKITLREQAIGITDEGSWHAKYKDSAYVYVGGLSFDLTEGDVLAVFAQYGEIVDVNLVRDKTTGKSKGFAFLAYEDQRSTVLAVDNLNGARVVGRIIKVDHVGDYKRKLEEDEEEKQRKREERGVCYAFQRGECNRGDDCKYSHDEERNANTGWGGGGGGGWQHDQFDGSMQEASRRMNMSSSTRRDGNGVGERDDKPRGVCYAFQRGECNRGDGCKFAHDEQRNTNPTRGGGWKPDQFDGSMREAARRMNPVSTNSNDLDEPPQRRRDTDRNRDDDVRRRRERREASQDRDDGRGRREEGRRRGRDGHDDDEERRDVRRDRDEDDDHVRKERERSDRGGDGRRRGRDDYDEEEEERRDVRRGKDEEDDGRKERERSDRGGERSVRSRR